MMQSDAQQKTTSIPLQDNQYPQRHVPMDEHYISDGQNTWLSDVAHRQPPQLPYGT